MLVCTMFGGRGVYIDASKKHVLCACVYGEGTLLLRRMLCACVGMESDKEKLKEK